MSDVIMPVVESVLLAVNIDEKSTSVVHAVQSDNLSRIIRVGFWDKDIEYVLDPESKVRFMIIRPDGIFAAKDCTINEDGNYAEVVLDEDLLSVPGDARAGFIVWDKDQEQSIRSQEFTLHIGEKLDKDENLPIDAPVTLAAQVKKNTEDIAELKKGGSGGSGISVVDSVSKMTNTESIYFLTTDNSFYYYKDNNWIVGGDLTGYISETTMQQAIENVIKNNSVDMKKITFTNRIGDVIGEYDGSTHVTLNIDTSVFDDGDEVSY